MEYQNANSIIEEIDENLVKLTKGQKKIAMLIKHDLTSISFLSAKKMGDRAGVSEATVHRLASTLGYKSFNDMQKNIQQLVVDNRTVVRLQQSDLTSGKISYVDKFQKMEIHNLHKTLTADNEQKIWLSAEWISQAKQIYVAGWKLGLAVTSSLSYSLQLMLGNAMLLPAGGELSEKIAYIGENDLLIAVGFPRYCKNTLFAVKEAKGLGAKVITITDNAGSPFLEFSDIVLYASIESEGFLDSYAAPLALSQAIIQAVSQSSRDRVLTNLKRMEHYFRQRSMIN